MANLDPEEVTDLELAFPVAVLGQLLPRPEWIGDLNVWLNSPWASLANNLFAGTPMPDLELTLVHDLNLIRRHIQACMGSFEPRHEEKIAGVAFLMALWLDIVWPEKDREAALTLQVMAREKALTLEWEVVC